jgi:ATP-dependent exoDNAse (exonuclease V) beta subunit
MAEVVVMPGIPFSPPDAAERLRALDPARSFLVQAPAGSGKTYLLTQRFLRLLAQAERPDEIVAITFTNASAAEMRNRILGELEKAEAAVVDPMLNADAETLASLAAAAMARSRLLGWQLLDQPSQLRITTIDAFCRGLALQSPLRWGILAGLGGALSLEDPANAYRQAARRTIESLIHGDSAARNSVEALLRWRDNNWQDVETLIVQMLGQRSRWYQDFVFERDVDWVLLRKRLEAPFLRSARRKLETLGKILDGLPGCREFALELARFACTNGGKSAPFGLAERDELPVGFEPAGGEDGAILLGEAIGAYRDLAGFLLTQEGCWRKKGGLNVNLGFPATPAGKAGKERFGEFVDSLAMEPGLETALGALQAGMPLRYSEEEWELVRHCFAVLREAAGQLQLVFAETGSVDFTEVAQIALRILAPENGFPSDFALRQADGIRHLLIDEFQDTSRNQHQLLSRLIGAWPEREGRSCFCVGDPMQSIYGFREAEVELFERVKTQGLEVTDGLDAASLPLEFVQLRANFRTAPSLVVDLNQHFARIFAEEDGSGVRFSAASPARSSAVEARTELHLAFTRFGKGPNGGSDGEPGLTRAAQLAETVKLIRDKLAAAEGLGRFRVAVLARARKSLVPVAEALRVAGIRYLALDLVKLNERPEVLDALSLARALLNPADRVAWLGVLRAPWCGLSLADLHTITSADDAAIVATPVPVLLETRLDALLAFGQIGKRGHAAAMRVKGVMRQAAEERAVASTLSLGTWLESVWKALGGEATVDEEQRENLRVLWATLDKLPDDELDLLGAGLDTALDKLYALPDPAASCEFGVQMMTIHRSKGLEFEVVIVPDLEAEGLKHDRGMMSWLERGLTGAEEGEPLTEFLIAPIQTKGGEASAAKVWVDGVKRERSAQELRRLLYVAATRAREELHLFARPRFTEKEGANGSIEWTLSKATGLLATAWPAFGGVVEERFASWTSKLGGEAGKVTALSAMAAANSTTLLQMPALPVFRTILRRLPEGFAGPGFGRRGDAAGDTAVSDLYARSEGGLESRLLGKAIHLLMERVSILRAHMNPQEAAESQGAMQPALTATMRGEGLPLPMAQQLAGEAIKVASRAAIDPVGAWICSPHPRAIAEARWSGIIEGELRNLRPDRVFFAPPMGGIGNPVWWIIDYKSGSASSVVLADPVAREAFLAERRDLYRGQLTIYARLLRAIHGNQSIVIQTGIYYPRLGLIDFWQA